MAGKLADWVRAFDSTVEIAASRDRGRGVHGSSLSTYRPLGSIKPRPADLDSQIIRHTPDRGNGPSYSHATFGTIASTLLVA